VCGLRDDLVAAYLNVPSLAHFRRAVEISDQGSRAEIAEYLAIHRERVEEVFGVLSYFDGMNFAARARTRAHFSVALMDRVCPPSTVFAAYNHYSGPKTIDVWPYNGHIGGGSLQLEQNLRALRALVGRS
jgi:cephalosporin-C deacetylase